MSAEVVVVGGGLAGCEAAWQIARRGFPVRLVEMRPIRSTAVHRTDGLAELVCSNSLKSLDPSNAHGLLKAEMTRLDSLILRCAIGARVPAGAALAVDREAFSAAITRAIVGQPRIALVREEASEIPEGIAVIAAGPLVSDPLAAAIARFTGEPYLHFFDAIAPVIEADSVDRGVVFAASRHGKGEGTDYLNCPMTEEEYGRFVALLLEGEKAPLRAADAAPFFEGCLPVEELARRGIDTLRFGPMRPVGLVDPRTRVRPHAVVQLRQDNLAATHHSMVGFQTRLRWPEQKRIFRTIPGLERAEFVRLGQIHRNCYVNAPKILRATLESRAREGLFFAGQISGVEGYTESAATGLLAGINAARRLSGLEPVVPGVDTMLGSLCRYVSASSPDGFQPMNAAFGLLPDTPGDGRRKRDRRASQADRAVRAIDAFASSLGVPRDEPALEARS